MPSVSRLRYRRAASTHGCSACRRCRTLARRQRRITCGGLRLGAGCRCGCLLCCAATLGLAAALRPSASLRTCSSCVDAWTRQATFRWCHWDSCNDCCRLHHVDRAHYRLPIYAQYLHNFRIAGGAEEASSGPAQHRASAGHAGADVTAGNECRDPLICEANGTLVVVAFSRHVWGKLHDGGFGLFRQLQGCDPIRWPR